MLEPALWNCAVFVKSEIKVMEEFRDIQKQN